MYLSHEVHILCFFLSLTHSYLMGFLEVGGILILLEIVNLSHVKRQTKLKPPAIICFGGERALRGFYRIDYIYFYLNKLNCLTIFRMGKIHDNILLFQQN